LVTERLPSLGLVLETMTMTTRFRPITHLWPTTVE